MAQRELDFTQRAQRDIRAILRRSRRLWGDAQRDVYREKLDSAFAELRAFPRLGADRSDLAPGIRRHVIQEHVVFYEFDDERILIVRVLHARMDETQHL